MTIFLLVDNTTDASTGSEIHFLFAALLENWYNDELWLSKTDERPFKLCTAFYLELKKSFPLKQVIERYNYARDLNKGYPRSTGIRRE